MASRRSRNPSAASTSTGPPLTLVAPGGERTRYFEGETESGTGQAPLQLGQPVLDRGQPGEHPVHVGPGGAARAGLEREHQVAAGGQRTVLHVREVVTVLDAYRAVQLLPPDAQPAQFPALHLAVPYQRGVPPLEQQLGPVAAGQ